MDPLPEANCAKADPTFTVQQLQESHRCGAIRGLGAPSGAGTICGARASDAEVVAYAFESAAKGIEGAGELRGIRAPPALVRRIARRQIKRIEEGCEEWLASDLGANWQKNPDAEAMLAALEHVLPACLPGPAGFATKNRQFVALH